MTDGPVRPDGGGAQSEEGYPVTLEEYLAVPYVLRVAAVRGADGQWLRRAEYPELPGCFGEGPSPEEAMADLDHNRERMVRELLAAGAKIPVPRPPLERLMRTGKRT